MERSAIGVADSGGGPFRALDVDVVSATKVSAEIASQLQRLAREFARHTDALAAAVGERAAAGEPALMDPDDPTSMESISHSTVDNVGAILSMLAYGVPGTAIQPPLGALELFERLAEREDGLTIILRGYRLGIMELWQMWARHVADRVDDTEELYQLLAASTSHMLTYVDRVSVQLGDQWTETRRRRRNGLDASPEELLRHALFGSGTGILRRLNYDEEHTHLALALPPSLEEAQVAQLASKLRVIGRAQSVSLHSEANWVLWLGFPTKPDGEVLDMVSSELGLSNPVGVGDPSPGLKGFRGTYREALDARRVGALRESPGVTRYHDVALLAVLTADSERARALARTELGRLADDEDDMSRLRDTVAAYLACGDSQVAAAHRLDVHQKTVAYRIRQAENVLGRRIGERRAELEAALLVHRAFHGDV